MTETLQPSFRVFAGRRSFLKRSGGAVLSATAIAVVSGSEALAVTHRNKDSEANDANALNTELGVEYEEIAARHNYSNATRTVN